jgi:hypothetical protein
MFSLVFYDNSINKIKSNVKTNKNIKYFVRKINYAESLGLEKNNQYVIISSPGARQNAFTPIVRVGSRHLSAVEVEIDFNKVDND